MPIGSTRRGLHKHTVKLCRPGVREQQYQLSCVFVQASVQFIQHIEQLYLKLKA